MKLFGADGTKHGQESSLFGGNLNPPNQTSNQN